MILRVWPDTIFGYNVQRRSWRGSWITITWAITAADAYNKLDVIRDNEGIK